jgi:hypothetical protein
MDSQNVSKTRLGDILLKKGLITAEQLQLAIDAQKTSDLPLGEILVANQCLTHGQIKKALKVQSKLRNAVLTSILSFSPLALVGCGGASEIGLDESTQVVEQVVDSSQANADESSENTESSDVITNASSDNNEAGDQGAIEDQLDDQSTLVDVVNEPEVLRDVQLSWAYPSQRTDGSDFEVYEAKTFRIYRIAASGGVDSMQEVDGLETEYKFESLPLGQHYFAITVVDSEGLESDFSETISVTI